MVAATKAAPIQNSRGAHIRTTTKVADSCYASSEAEGADKAYDAEDFINELRSMKVTPHVAQNTSGRSSAIDGRTTRHAGYAVSQRIRKRIEEAFGWIKMVAGLEQTKFRGRDRVGWAFRFAATAYNLTRLPKLLGRGMSAPSNCQLPPPDRQGRHLRSPSSRYLCALVISARQSAFFFNGLLILLCQNF